MPLHSYLIFLAMALFLQSFSAVAYSLYQCRNEKGQVAYSDTPCDATAKKIELTVAEPISSITGSGLRPGEKDLLQKIEEEKEKKANAPPPPPSKPRYRGMPFKVYRVLHKGMSEGEVLYIAGAPDKETTDAVNTHAGYTNKSYYYIKQGHNSNITRVRFINGTVASIERDLVHSRPAR